MKCLINQWRISRSLDQKQALPDSASRHTAGCDACRRFYELHRGVDEALKAPSRSLEVPGFLHDNIMNAVEEAPPSVVTSPPAWAWAVVVLLAGSFWLGRLAQPQPEVGEFADITSIQEAVTGPLAKLAVRPEEELQRIKNDVRSAADFLFARL